MRMTICLLAGCIAVGFLSQLISQAADEGVSTSPPRIYDSDGQERYLKIAKRKVELLAEEKRYQEIHELADKIEKEVEHIESARRQKQEEKEADKKLSEAKILLKEIIETHPDTYAATIAERTIDFMRTGPRRGTQPASPQTGVPSLPVYPSPATSVPSGPYSPPAIEK